MNFGVTGSLFRFRCFAFVALISALLACSNSGDISEPRVDSEYLESLSLDDFVFVRSNGLSVILGTDDPSASIKERPSMQAKFGYDFYLARHEVTCAEMGKDCDDSLPVTDVTFFDAVLYANSRSKIEGFDTVYTYSGASYDQEGACIGLESLVPHFERLGYRLPTEAEWTFVASRDWVPSESWNAENSDYMPHKVCSSFVSSEGMCDMAGNVMEWVGDFLTLFSSKDVENFVGGKKENGPDERVVKGGSFRNAASVMQLHNRSDVYLVTSSSKASYIGFRLALGPIYKPQYLGGSSKIENTSVLVLAGWNALWNATDGLRSKLVFRNDETGNLVYVVTDSGFSRVNELNNAVSSYHPDISPDGNWVAFCTGIEGVSGESSVYVRGLGSSDNSLLKLNVKSAAIPRWRVLDNGDTVIVYVNSAANNRDDTAFESMETWQVSFRKGKFGTPEKLFDGGYHGGVSRDNRLSVTGARLLRVLRDGKAEVWYGGEQVCNVSQDSKGSKSTLFLDFAGKTGREFSGDSYGVHERLFFVDSTGKLVRSIKSPSGFTFDHTEWVAGSDSLVVATLANAEGAHRKVVLINAFSGDVLDLVQGEELWHPALWIDPAERGLVDRNLNIDSAGVYYTDQLTYYALELRVKMEQFWKSRDSLTVAVLGSSRSMFGVNSSFVQSEKLVNMAFSSGDVHGMNFLAKNYVLKHAPRLKYIVLEFSPDFMWTIPESSWQPVYQNAPGYRYDESHNFWMDSIPKGYMKLVSESSKPDSVITLPYSLDEFLLPANGWGSPEVLNDSNMKSLDSPQLQYNMGLMKEIVDIAATKCVKVVLLVTPQNPRYANTGSFSIYAVRRSDTEELLKQASAMGAVLFDENKMGLHDYSSSMAYNTDHLARAGAEQLSNRLDSLFAALDDGRDDACAAGYE